MGFLNALLGNQTNAADSAMPYLNQVSGIGQQNYAPYNQQGQNAFQQAGSIYGQQASDPAAFLEQLRNNYTMSGGYKMKLEDALKAARGASAASGIGGTPEDIKNQMKIAQNIGDLGFQDYYNQVTGLQNTGLEGLSHQGDIGFQGAGQLSDYLGNALGNQAQTAYQGQAQLNQNDSDLLGNLLKAGGMAATGPFGSLGADALKKLFMGNQQNNPSQSFMDTMLGGQKTQGFPGSLNYFGGR